MRDSRTRSHSSCRPSSPQLLLVVRRRRCRCCRRCGCCWREGRAAGGVRRRWHERRRGRGSAHRRPSRRSCAPPVEDCCRCAAVDAAASVGGEQGVGRGLAVRGKALPAGPSAAGPARVSPAWHHATVAEGIPCKARYKEDLKASSQASRSAVGRAGRACVAESFPHRLRRSPQRRR